MEEENHFSNYPIANYLFVSNLTSENLDDDINYFHGASLPTWSKQSIPCNMIPHASHAMVDYKTKFHFKTRFLKQKNVTSDGLESQ